MLKTVHTTKPIKSQTIVEGEGHASFSDFADNLYEEI